MGKKFMTPWDPFGIARSLRSEIDRLIDVAVIRPAGWLASWEPAKAILPLEVCVEDDNLIVKAAMPGLKSDEVTVEVRGDVLTIVGESKLEQESEEHGHLLRDHFFVRLERSVALPALVNAEQAEAVFANGVLTVTLPKTGQTQTGQIAIKTAEQGQAAEARPVAAETAEPQMVQTGTVADETVAAQPARAETVMPEPTVKAIAEAEPVEAAPAEAKKVKRQRTKRQKQEAVKVEAEKVA